MTDKKLPCGCGGVSSPHSDLKTAAPDVINQPCHGFLGGVTAHDKHVVPDPQIVLIFWDQYFTDTPAAVTTMNQFVSDLAAGNYWSGLSQYGVNAATLAGSVVIDMTSFPTPNSQHPGQPFSESQMQDQLRAWLSGGTVALQPAGDEKNLVYLIFAPSDTTLTLGGKTGFCGYHEHGRFNATTSRDNLIWGTVRGFSKPAGASAGQGFVDSISFCVSHELSEAFSNPDDRGFFNDDNGCEIGDICETDAAHPCCLTFPYTVSGRTWSVEQYWSNLDARCLIGPTTWLPGSASRLDGYATDWNEQQHVNYVAGDASIHELLYNGRWGNRVLTVAAQTGSAVPLPQAGSPLVGYPSGWNEQQHVNYVAQDGHVHELVYGDGSWRHSDLSQRASGTGATSEGSLPRAGGLLAGYPTGWNEQQHAVYVAQDGHVHELVYGDGSWRHSDLSQRASGTGATSEGSLPGRAAPLVGYPSGWNEQQHVNYVAQDGHVHELVYGDGSWRHSDLSQRASGTGATSEGSLPRAGGLLAGYPTGWNEQQHAVYVAQDGHVHELVYGDGSWRHSDLSQRASGTGATSEGSLPGRAAPLVGYPSGWNEQQHVNYVAQDGHVHELVYGDGSWRHSDLSQRASGTGATSEGSLPRAGGLLAGYPTGWNEQQHAVYVAQDGHVHELVYGDGGWRHSDLSQRASAN